MAGRPKPVKKLIRAKILTNSWKIKLLPKPVGKTRTSRPHKSCSMAWLCSSFSFISCPKRADKSHKTSFILSISTIKSTWSDLKDSCNSDASHTSFSSGFSQWESLPSFGSGRNATFNGIVASFPSFSPPVSSPLPSPKPKKACYCTQARVNWIELNWIELNWIELNWIELNWIDKLQLPILNIYSNL